MAHRFIEVLVVAYFTVVGATDLQRINCKEKDGTPCARYYDTNPSLDANVTISTRRDYTWLYVTIVAAALVFIGIFTTCCLCCFFCPLYRHRKNKGIVYATRSKPQRNVVIYPPAMPNTHQLNFQPSLHSAYPGIIYSPGQAQVQPQTQTQTQMQPANEPYYNKIPGYKQNPGIGYSAGSPQRQPPYYRNAQYN